MSSALNNNVFGPSSVFSSQQEPTKMMASSGLGFMTQPNNNSQIYNYSNRQNYAKVIASMVLSPKRRPSKLNLLTTKSPNV